MFDTLPKNAQEALNWDWSQYQPYFDELLGRELNATNVEAWLSDSTAVLNLLSEVSQRLDVAMTVNTNDTEAEKLFLHFIENIVPEMRKAENAMNRKLLDSGLQVKGMEVAMRKNKAQVEIFREENLPLYTELKKLTTEYDKIKGAQTVVWEGEERTLSQMDLGSPSRFFGQKHRTSLILFQEAHDGHFPTYSSDFVNVNGIRLHYLDWGGKGPVLLFLAGLGCSAHIFDRFAPRFVDKYHVLALTRRGHGESPTIPIRAMTSIR